MLNILRYKQILVVYIISWVSIVNQIQNNYYSNFNNLFTYEYIVKEFLFTLLQ